MTLHEILQLEESIIELEKLLKKEAPPLQDRDYYGTLHCNLLALVRVLEERFGFARGSR